MSLHFKPSESYCKCKSKCKKVATKFITIIIIEMLHAYLLVTTPGAIKIRIVIISGIRCPYWNKHEGGSDKSHHLVEYGGDAVDIKCYALYEPDIFDDVFFKRKKRFEIEYWLKINPKIIHHFLDKLFPGSLGLGLYKTFNHIDPREIRARWNG